MVTEQTEILSFFEALEEREAEKKAIADDIKESVATFALNNEINKKAVAKAYKDWRAWKKDQQDFVEVEYESDALLIKAVPEMGATGGE